MIIYVRSLSNNGQHDNSRWVEEFQEESKKFDIIIKIPCKIISLKWYVNSYIKWGDVNGDPWFRDYHGKPSFIDKSKAYNVLGISQSSSQQEIKAAHRLLVKVHHPDLGGDPQKFKEIQEAYELLTKAG